MNSNLVSFLACILISACHSNPIKQDTSISNQSTFVIDNSKFSMQKNYFLVNKKVYKIESLNPYIKIHIEIDSTLKLWQYFILAIDLKSGKLFQKIKVKLDNPIETNPPFELVDMNFDGYDDIRFITERSSDGNVWNQCWLFDAIANKFIFHEGLTKLISSVFYPATKIIEEGYWGGFSHQQFNTYTIHNNNLKIIRDESINEGSKFCHMLYQLKDNKMQLVLSDDSIFILRKNIHSF